MAPKIGEIDGKLPIEQALASMSGYYDMKAIDTTTLDEDIDLYSVIGTGSVGVDVFNTTSSDGNVLVKTMRDESDGYIAVPVKAKLRSGLLARFRYIKKTGSITTMVICYQKMNQ